MATGLGPDSVFVFLFSIIGKHVKRLRIRTRQEIHDSNKCSNIDMSFDVNFNYVGMRQSDCRYVLVSLVLWPIKIAVENVKWSFLDLIAIWLWMSPRFASVCISYGFGTLIFKILKFYLQFEFLVRLLYQKYSYLH